MDIIRFNYDNDIRYGVLKKTNVIEELRINIFEQIVKTGKEISIDEVEILPCVSPSKIIGIGLNYYDHIKESGLKVPENPYVVFRPPSSINTDGKEVFINHPEHFVQFEGELVVVIGKKCKNIEENEADNYIFGYTCGNDITDKYYFKRDGHFGIAKAFDTQCVIGSIMKTDFEPINKSIKTYVNNEIRQDGNTNDMVFNIKFLISYLSKIMTLFPGDIIFTGSPAGNDNLENGDEVVVEIENLGKIKNKTIKQR